MPFVKKTDSQPTTDVRKIFIGREGELLFFRQNILKAEDPTHNIISISGQGGVGKSTLLTHFMEETYTTNFKDYCLTAIVDERQATPASMMEKFAEQLHIKGKFKKALDQYKEILRKQRAEREAPLETFLGKMPGLASSIVKDVPFAGGFLKEGTEAASDFLVKKYRYHQLLKDTQQEEDPIGDLTKAFVLELNQLANAHFSTDDSKIKGNRRVILFFDIFEQLTKEVSPWLLDHFLEADISSNVVLVIAGRKPIEHSDTDNLKRWLAYYDNNVIYSISLNSFSYTDTCTYLAERGINDIDHIKIIWRLSRGLPLYLSLLTSNQLGKVDPTKKVVDNFLRWIPEQEQVKRRLALDAALLSEPFNLDDLAAFKYLENDLLALYRWLTEQPFILSNPQDGRYRYHELAQELFSRHLYQLSPIEYLATRRALADYYQQLLEKIQEAGGREVYNSIEWLKLLRSLAYQLFFLPDEVSHIKAVEYVLNAYEHTEQIGEIVRFLYELCYKLQNDQVNRGTRQMANELLQYIEADLGSQEFLVAASFLIEKVSHQPTFSIELLAKIYHQRGNTYNSLEEYKRAIEDFNNALLLNPKSVQTYIERGLAYFFLEEEDQAIADHNQAISLDPKNASNYLSRGRIYFSCNEYQLAINDYDHVLALDPKSPETYFHRGLAYYYLNEYRRAIKDFSDAIALNPQNGANYFHRGLAYSSNQEHERAIEDFNRVITISPRTAWVYVQRAHTYGELQKYEQAITDYGHAISFDPKNAWIYVHRGIDYCILKKYRQATKDFSSAIELEPKFADAYAYRGLAYKDLEEHEQAIKDINLALELDPKLEWVYPHRGSVYFSLKGYEQALADFDRTLEVDPTDAPAYRIRGNINLLLKSFGQARTDFLQSWKLDHTDINNGWMAEWSGMCFKKTYSGLAKRLESIAAVYPEHYVAYICRGVALWLRKRFEDALRELEQALLLEPEVEDAYFWKGMLYAFLNRDEDAIVAIEKSLELGLPPVLLTPLRWLEQDRPDFYQKFVMPLFAHYELTE